MALITLFRRATYFFFGIFYIFRIGWDFKGSAEGKRLSRQICRRLAAEQKGRLNRLARRSAAGSDLYLQTIST
jgi:hypothetical protein